MAYVLRQGWYLIVDMQSGKTVLPVFDSLGAFWPAVQARLGALHCASSSLRYVTCGQVLYGDVEGAMDSIRSFVKVWHFFGFTPEKADLIEGGIWKGQAR